MMTDLEPIEGAVYSVCSECDHRLLVEPDKPLPLITHNDDGSHSVAFEGVANG